MQSIQGNMLESLLAVEAFLDENKARLGKIVNTGTRRKLSERIASLAQHVAAQAGNTRESQSATRKKDALRRVLIRDHMAPVARIAEAEPLSDDDTFRMPRDNCPDQRLRAAALGMADAARPHAATFIEAGLPDDFIEQLITAAEAMSDSVSQRAQTRGRASGATKGLKTSLAEGRKLVRVIDSFVTSTLADDPALLANWRRVKRVRKVPVHAPDDPAPASTRGLLTSGDVEPSESEGRKKAVNE